MDLLPNLIVAGFYAAVAFDFWRSGKTDLPRNHAPWHQVAIGIGLLLHGILLSKSLFVGGLNLGLTNALSAIFWLTVLIYWIAALKHELHSLQAFVLPPAAVFVLLQGLFPETHLVAYADRPAFVWHLVISMLAYSLLTFAALHALLMAIAERSLHRKPTLLRLPGFPPLLPMEKLLFRIITLGFALLTLTLISGIVFSEELFHQALRFNHKNVFALISWAIFGALLIGRYQHGWRGKKAIRWTLSGFALLLLAYVGSKFVLEIILGR
ncbi:MAG: cytochrome c biogenesis protein CcsA [Methylobacillus sp.]|jgi:ABC-type uncharacterized transport system permease subunit|nr:cytochrome c biogenesis protein CcsA [Methylobacillus sp.]